MRDDRSSWVIPLALLFVVLAAMGATAAAPFVMLVKADRDITEDRQTIADLLQKLNRLRETTTDEPQVLEIKPLLLDGSTTGIAAANLQKKMNDMALRANGTPSRFQVGPPQEDGDLVRLDVSLVLEIDTKGLRGLIHEIETGLPLLIIDDFIVRPSSIELQAGDSYFSGPLEVTLRVSGFMQKREAS